MGTIYEAQIVVEETCNWQCYIDRYPELLLRDKGEAESHYRRLGAFEGRDCTCSTACNWQCYLNRYPSLKRRFGTNLDGAKEHYHTIGAAKGLDCSCPPTPGYTAFNGDCPGNTLWGTDGNELSGVRGSYASCAERCESTRSCAGFSFQGSSSAFASFRGD